MRRMLRSFLLVSALVACGGFPLAVAAYLSGDAEAAEPSAEVEVAAPDKVAEALRTRPDLIEVKVRQVATAPDGSLHVVFLAPSQGKQVMPLFVTEGEAQAIASRMEDEEERPDPELVERLLSRLGGEIKGVIITDLVDAEMSGYVLVSIPSRPDLQVPAPAPQAVALALSRKAPILVARELLDVVGFTKDDLKRLQKDEGPERPDWAGGPGTSL